MNEKRRTVNLLRILYPIWSIVGLFSLMYVPGKLIVEGDAATTASNILGNGFLFRLGIVGSLITQILFIFTAVLLYKLFKDVNKEQSILMVILALVAVPIAMISELGKLAALFLLGNPEQMMFFLNLNLQGIVIASIFWGLWLFPLGSLIYESNYFPKLVGIAVIIGGIGYTLDSFVKLLLPNLTSLAPVFEVMLFGELVFILWIVIRGAKLTS